MSSLTTLFGVGSAVFPILFFLVIATILVIVVYAFVKMARKRQPPLLMVDVRFISSRSEPGENGEELYYLAFELSTGDKMELLASKEESEMFETGEEGKVAFRGIKFDSFYEKIVNQ